MKNRFAFPNSGTSSLPRRVMRFATRCIYQKKKYRSIIIIYLYANVAGEEGNLACHHGDSRDASSAANIGRQVSARFAKFTVRDGGRFPLLTKRMPATYLPTRFTLSIIPKARTFRSRDAPHAPPDVSPSYLCAFFFRIPPPRRIHRANLFHTVSHRL